MVDGAKVLDLLRKLAQSGESSQLVDSLRMVHERDWQGLLTSATNAPTTPTDKLEMGPALAGVTDDMGLASLVRQRAILQKYADAVSPLLAQARAPESDAAEWPEQVWVDSVAPERRVSFHNATDRTAQVTVEATNLVVHAPEILSPGGIGTLAIRPGKVDAGQVDVLLDKTCVLQVVVGGQSDERIPRIRMDEESLTAALRELQLMILRYPLGSQALFRALVAEGRSFATTAAGQAWRDRLTGSKLVDRGRVVWEVSTMKLLEEEAPSALPSKLLDAFSRATQIEELETFLSQLFQEAQ